MKQELKSSKKLTVSEYIISLIEKTGVDLVPVITGGAIMKLVDDIGRNSKLKYLCPNHEQALAMIVDAYARIKGFGVGLVTSGPGGTNLITGICCSYYDSIPCLFISGQVGMFHMKGKRVIRQRGFQETDIISVVKSITKHAVLLDNPEKTRYEFEKAVYMAKSGRPGPVLIDLPYNIQRALIDPDKLIGFIPEKWFDHAHHKKKNDSEKQLEKASRVIIKELKNAKKPLILVGGGVRLANQVETINKVVSYLQIPVVTTWGALDNFDWNHKLYGGNIGRLGNPSALKMIDECDLLLALGTRFTTKAIINEKEFSKQAKIISVDVDNGELNEGLISPQIKIQAELQDFLPNFLNLVKKQKITLNINEWRKRVNELKINFFHIKSPSADDKNYVNPYYFMEILSELLQHDDIIVADCGTNLTWAVQGYKPKKGQRFISAWGNSPMGYALPAAIGAYYANKNVNVVVTTGDGGFQMNIQELQTIAVNKIPVKVFILNNQCYANIKFPAREQFNGRTFATESSNGYEAPDFVKIATAYGLKSLRIKFNKNLKEKIKSILSKKEPIIIDVMCDPELYVFDNV